MMQVAIATRLQGIPCIAEVDYYPGTNYPINSASEIANDPFDYEITMLDRKGYKANWLQKKLTDKDKERIFDEMLKVL